MLMLHLVSYIFFLLLFLFLWDGWVVVNLLYLLFVLGYKIKIIIKKYSTKKRAECRLGHCGSEI